ncbi:hypothetical protein HMPREF9714_02609 [Myroides odoratimimus CCUG 12901]|uniref:hypothetical protein n=1 Tax=Myroides odoratimimus TaxID=76832 RepID=UPI0002460976|nr:hypothetical protein [Myroides odoratimimus]EHO07529.1 hypothetical protein HMPREF9714_02609 [Myroides odoratimimus CCUG 12901]MDM1400423.1 hypothetical protein [Myroides odoratimimus]MDM1410482.1 hypothetical protein [Myroides odoratimimus]MDM1535967.1 hypothetical protein [Myroides odoratimimus]MDM1675540.1 hypothetical protein [Myroides odoratimimus]
MEGNKNIIIGPKDSKNKDYYDLLKFLKEKEILVSKFLIFQRSPVTNEKFKYKEIHFRREYINRVSEHLHQLDFETVSKIPTEPDNCAFRLEVRYTPSGSVFGFQIIEARTGFGGGYFGMTPAVVLLEEEGKRAVELLKPILK